ncbi:MAG: opacity family porin [Pasteurellaceae bacterium]|nr:opacity family porin [Pasteurellaceae bacterium]
MKKVLLAILGAVAIVSTAQAGWYTEGNVGYSKVKSNDVSKRGFSPSIAVGYDTGDIRFAADYTHYRSAHNANSSLKAQGFGVSAIYDIEMGSPIKPYVGVRLSTNDIESKTVKTHGNTTTIKTTDTYKFGYGAMAGAQYKLNPNWSLNGGVEYNRLGKANDSDINQYGAKAGVRYDF